MLTTKIDPSILQKPHRRLIPYILEPTRLPSHKFFLTENISSLSYQHQINPDNIYKAPPNSDLQSIGNVEEIPQEALTLNPKLLGGLTPKQCQFPNSPKVYLQVKKKKFKNRNETFNKSNAVLNIENYDVIDARIIHESDWKLKNFEMDLCSTSAANNLRFVVQNMNGDNKAFSAIKSAAFNSINHGNSMHTDLSRMDSSHERIAMATKYGLLKKQLGAMLDPHDYLRKMPTVPKEHYLSIAKRPIPYKGKVPGEVDPVKY